MPNTTTLQDVAPEALWLGNEIEKLALHCGKEETIAKRLRELTEKLANEIFEKNATCIKINDPKTVEFLRENADDKILAYAPDPTTHALLIFDDQTNPQKPILYFLRQFYEEYVIAENIAHFLQSELKQSEMLDETTEQIIKKIVEPEDSENVFEFALNTEQKKAVRQIFLKNFTIVLGGPGTGKTTLLFRALLALKIQNPKLAIAIVAPTGKAALRIQESIASQKVLKELKEIEGFSDIVAEIKNLTPKTLNDFLEIHQWNPQKPKEICEDVVVIDEASMISQNLMMLLLQALRPTTKLVLLGDSFQLDSVEAGHVFGDFCFSRILSGNRVELLKSQRFKSEDFLGQIAIAIKDGNTLAVKEKIKSQDQERKGIFFQRCSSTYFDVHRLLEEVLSPIFKEIPEYIEERKFVSYAKSILKKIESCRILTPIKKSPWGTHALNKAAKRIFAPNAAENSLYHGAPIIITGNNKEQSLYNGDIGIVLQRYHGRLEACFLKNSQKGELKIIPVEFLPTYELAYAMTIHKSQGSEFSKLLILLPQSKPNDDPENNNFYTRELLYTALTRFKETKKSELYFLYSEKTLETCIEHSSNENNFSLLKERIESELEFSLLKEQLEKRANHLRHKDSYEN